jgi:Asp-tRNA(Asn)/Glu-tRNA(Gln) amidotransferase A subunit family amidase
MEYEKYKQLLSAGIKQKIRNGKKISACDYIKALKTRDEIKLAFQDFFELFDAIITPSSLNSAPLLKNKNTGDPCLSTIWSLCGFPMISLPILKLDNAMPYGVQLIGSPNDDARLLRTARWLIKNFGENHE